MVTQYRIKHMQGYCLLQRLKVSWFKSEWVNCVDTKFNNHNEAEKYLLDEIKSMIIHNSFPEYVMEWD